MSQDLSVSYTPQFVSLVLTGNSSNATTTTTTSLQYARSQCGSFLQPGFSDEGSVFRLFDEA